MTMADDDAMHEDQGGQGSDGVMELDASGQAVAALREEVAVVEDGVTEAEMADVEDAEVADTSVELMPDEPLAASPTLEQPPQVDAVLVDALHAPVGTVPAQLAEEAAAEASDQAPAQPRPILATELSHDDGYKADLDQVEPSSTAPQENGLAEKAANPPLAASREGKAQPEDVHAGDGSVDAAAAAPVASQTAGTDAADDEPQSHEPFPPMRLGFDGHAFVLHSGEDSSAPLSFVPAPGSSKDGANGREPEKTTAPGIKVDETIFLQPLEALIQQLRAADALGEFLEDDTEIVLTFPDLDLVITEDNIYAREVTLEDIYNLHTGCGFEHSLHIVVSEGARFINRFNALSARADDAAAAVAASMGKAGAAKDGRRRSGSASSTAAEDEGEGEDDDDTHDATDAEDEARSADGMGAAEDKPGAKAFGGEDEDEGAAEAEDGHVGGEDAEGEESIVDYDEGDDDAGAGAGGADPADAGDDADDGDDANAAPEDDAEKTPSAAAEVPAAGAAAENGAAVNGNGHGDAHAAGLVQAQVQGLARKRSADEGAAEAAVEEGDSEAAVEAKRLKAE